MSIVSKLYNFISSASEDLSVVTTTAKLSDAIGVGAANLGDGATDLYFVVECVSGTTGTGTTYTVELLDGPTSSPTTTKFSQSVAHTAGTLPVGEVVRTKLPNGLDKYLKARITGGAGESGTSVWRARIAMS